MTFDKIKKRLRSFGAVLRLGIKEQSFDFVGAGNYGYGLGTGVPEILPGETNIGSFVLEIFDPSDMVIEGLLWWWTDLAANEQNCYQDAKSDFFHPLSSLFGSP